MSLFASVELVPGDPILGLTEAYNADPRTQKVNLGVGIYYDEQGRIPLLDCVRRVEEALAAEGKPRGYLPIDGLAAYDAATRELVFGKESELVAAGRVATTQTIGGSGALRVGADLLKKLLPHATVAISNPSWENHRAVFGAAGFDIVDYTYFDAASHGLDFGGMLADLARLEPGTTVLLHACCHNPTGADLTEAQWKQVAALLKERQLFPFIDMAYQGFDKGIAEDAVAIRLLVEAGIDSFVVASSYSKSFSLYGERVGALSIVAASADEAKAIRIADNAKTQKYSPCNASEGLLVARGVAAQFLPRIGAVYAAKGVEMRGCPESLAILQSVAGAKLVPATEQDWSEEYLAPIISVKVVADVDEAIAHINRYSSHHTDAILTTNHLHAQRFLREVDSASVMVNASTRFADGFEFGLGAEIGISTDKFHARGPVGLEGLTSLKYVVLGEGEVRV